MTDVIFDCPQCNNEIVVEERGSGLELSCPHCAQPVVVPTPDPFARLLALEIPMETCQHFYGAPENEGWSEALDAVVALGASAVDAIYPLLISKDDFLKLSGLLVLSKISLPPEANLTEPLISALSSGHARIRFNAAKLLGKLHDWRALEPLRELVKRDSNRSVRDCAQHSIKELGAVLRSSS